MDRIRPFIALIRTLRARKQEPSGSVADRSSQAGESTTGSQSTPTPPSAPFQSALQVRLQTLSSWDSARARRIFVEQVLISELGHHFTRDPQFAELIDEVSELIADHPKSSNRLNQLLKSLAESQPS